MSGSTGLATTYGSWGLVAGGSAGMGGEYSNRLAAEGLNVVVVAHRADEVAAKCRQVEADFGVETVGVVVDLGSTDALERVTAAVDGREIGFLVYNAGLAGIGPFESRDLEHELYRLDLNVRNMLAFTLCFVKPMVQRGRGAILLMSSGGGAVGSPYIQTYSATKAYALALGEALWGEYDGTGVDVLTVLPGQTIGESFADVPPGTPGFQTGADVVTEAFEALGHAPTVVTGEQNRVLLAPHFRQAERREAIRIMADRMRATAIEYGTGS